MKIKTPAFQKAFGRYVTDNGMNPKNLTPSVIENFVKETYPGVKKVMNLGKVQKLTT